MKKVGLIIFPFSYFFLPQRKRSSRVPDRTISFPIQSRFLLEVANYVRKTYSPPTCLLLSLWPYLSLPRK